MEICSTIADGALQSLSYENHQFIIEITWTGDFPEWMDTAFFHKFDWTTNENYARKSKFILRGLDEVSVFEAVEQLQKCNLIAWDTAQMFTKNINKFLMYCCH